MPACRSHTICIFLAIQHSLPPSTDRPYRLNLNSFCLEKDYLNQPFKSMMEILAISDSITRLKAECHQCGKDATYSHRKNTNSKAQLLIGSENFYEALCEKCFNNNVL